jgi:cellulose biosynthesis protein BcsQ
MDKNFDIILLDTAGKLDTDVALDTQEVTKAIAYVDYLFLPFVAGMFTFGATLQFFRFAEKMEAERRTAPRPLHLVGFVNLFKFRSRRHTFLLEDITKLLQNNPLDFMENRLGEFASFAEADTYQTLYAPLSSDPAKANFTAWLNEFCKTIKITN